MEVINTNVMSINAQRNLSRTASSLATSLQRLSSGLRINSARDDAAGLAISERFTSQIRGLTQASRNANDGISLAQTAEGALAEVTNNLQRIRELAVQSANATNSSSDRAALQVEVDQLVAEMDRVASQTSFNGVKMLDGTFANQVFQVGADAGQTITISDIASARTSGLGQRYEASITGTAVTAALVAGDLTVNGAAVGASANFSGTNGRSASSAYAIARAINNAQSDVVATANATSAAGTTTATTLVGDTATITINGATTASYTGTGVPATDRAAIVQLINDISAASGVTATDDGTGIDLTAADGRDIAYSFSTTAWTAAEVGFSATATTRGTITLTSSSSIELGGATEVSAGFTDAQTATAALTGTAISNVSIASVDGATDTLRSVDAALQAINESRANLGAIQNRFSSVVVSLDTTNENLAASRSRIRDADFAKETAELTRVQILQQAGTAMLAQANAAPQSVLSLLRG
jgi:flagellin